MTEHRGSTATIRQIEFELEKAEHGMGMPYVAERVMQLRSMLREARMKFKSRLEAKDWCLWHHPRVPVVDVGRDESRRVVAGRTGKVKGDRGRTPDWLKFKKPDAPAVKREAEEDWGR